MTREDYDKKLAELQKEFNKKKMSLDKLYAAMNNPYNRGDVIRDHMTILRIEKMKMSYDSNRMPCLVYYGPRLKKNLEPYVSGEEGRIHQTNIIKNEQ